MTRERGRFAGPVAMLLLVGAVGGASGCGSPVAPSSSSVAGAWIANSTLTAASGGECVGSTLQAAVGSRDIFLTALKQSGSALEATVTSQGNGTSCAYAGSVQNGAVSMNMTACQAIRIAGIVCSSGEVRDLQPMGGAITAHVNIPLGTGAGTDASTWTIFMPNSNVPVGTLSLTASFTWVFLGVPSSDYHVFTGTIFPGYADGTISIPADPNPFCSKCGWFFR